MIKSALLLSCIAFPAQALDPQNPSPMVEHTREHPRLTEAKPEGARQSVEAGTLFVPAALASHQQSRLLIALHCGTWIPEVAAARHQLSVLTIQSGKGYKHLFEGKPETLQRWLDEAAKTAGMSWTEIIVTGWSNGCSGLRELLRSEAAATRIDRALFIDGIHTSYISGKPGPLESNIDTQALTSIQSFARSAVAGRKRMLVVHGEIFPGTYASTTETADWLLRELKVKRRPVLRWGPMKTQQLSEAKSGGFELLGFAGNSAPDHVDQLHTLGDWLEMLLSEAKE